MVDGPTEATDLGRTESNRALVREFTEVVLAVSEGFRAGVHSSFYDLFRAAEGKLVERCDTIEAVLPPSEWKNNNGKF